MAKEFWTVAEVIELFQIDDHFLVELEEEEIVCPVCREKPPSRVFTPDDMEKLRLAKVLTDDMGVNIPGVEIILRMRQNMLQMKRQFDTILEDLVRQMKNTYPEIFERK